MRNASDGAARRTGSRSARVRGRRRIAALLALLVAALVALSVGVLPGGGSTTRAAGASGAEEVSVQTDDSLPARDVTIIGSSPEEASGETWGVGELGRVNSSQFASNT